MEGVVSKFLSKNLQDLRIPVMITDNIYINIKGKPGKVKRKKMC